jgi:hypothetical protein
MVVTLERRKALWITCSAMVALIYYISPALVALQKTKKKPLQCRG